MKKNIVLFSILISLVFGSFVGCASTSVIDDATTTIPVATTYEASNNVYTFHESILKNYLFGDLVIGIDVMERTNTKLKEAKPEIAYYTICLKKKVLANTFYKVVYVEIHNLKEGTWTRGKPSDKGIEFSEKIIKARENWLNATDVNHLSIGTKDLSDYLDLNTEHGKQLYETLKKIAEK